jgi:hypothetical protein
MNWGFYQQLPTDPIRNPISGEFFSTEAVGNVTEALVREAIQNSLDARQRKLDRKRVAAEVRIFLSGESAALSTERVTRWFGSIWKHIQAPGNGLRDQPSPSDVCPFLVIEDFGTTGLTGDPAEHQVISDVPNNFLNFFRAEGHSDKGEQDRGSWGVGKMVFPRASRISSFFGLTVRADDAKRLLLGRSILKYHRVASQSFKSDGYCGLLRAGDGFVLPSQESRLIEEFRTDFQIKRKEEPGLSVVVPWYDVYGDDTITRDKLLIAVLHGFFYPILMGHLAVTIASPSSETRLHDFDSLIREITNLGSAIDGTVLGYVDLALWAQTRKAEEFLSLAAPDPERAQRWSTELVPSTVLQELHKLSSTGTRIALRVPMSVRVKGGGSIATFFSLFLERSDLDAEKPLFIRDELIIPDVKAPRASRMRALVIVEDQPLAMMLRDAETPAHTQWNSTTGHFKNKYTFGTAAIDYVRFCVSELQRIAHQADQKPDPYLTIDYFSIPLRPEDTADDAIPTRRRKAKETQGVDTTTPTVIVKSQPRRFQIQRLRGGFSIRRGAFGTTPPPVLEIRMAYDVRHGNPIKRYHPADFDVGIAPITWKGQSKGVSVITAMGNTLAVKVDDQDFHLDVTGFDPERDLYVRAIAREVLDADQTN